ncbi:rhodanese-like domain-containing protein [Shewanella sp. D64]|uniref:rhodanese-like domain-containing protein n=1 Tax=unclassified Shewanella TaxID=196818 RepID=UPI0022BA3EF5|nr:MULTISPECIES: rhodanese-like domain-containing protein [unclassified Shewanella]MEC4724954.1 rhodanese-like domain-containing protein [Shewanella sp. D64]MEC4736855.1 rhodanese-like domain-containing protein [Shewanella sp. E94]WBJ96453.1 rhodanese-like domain-containing protein [Shewanella sp. MTB7]
MLKTIAELVAETRGSINCINAKDAAVKCTEMQGVLIDVREPAESAQQAVKGALLIPRGIVEMKMMTQYPDAEQAIFTHCASGVRACLAAEQLVRLGYNNVWAITCKLDAVCAANS